MKNYYDILCLSFYEDSQDAILLSYKNGTKKLQELVSKQKDVELRLIELNEAFLVLSDKSLKVQYDYCLSKNTETQELAQNINVIRERATEFITSRLVDRPKKKKKNVWPAILCGLFLLSVLGTILRTCGQTYLESATSNAENLGSIDTPSAWSTYELNNAFTVSIPPKMELRHDYDRYTRFLQNNHLMINNADAVFQQAGLANMTSEGYDTYARVMLQYFYFGPDEVEHHYETTVITPEDRKNLREMVDAELNPNSYEKTPTYRWVDISGTKAMEAKYSRTGIKGPVNCRIYLFSNYDELVKLIVSYRECDADYWKEDLDNVVRTFKWNNPK